MFICGDCCDKIDTNLRHGFYTLSNGRCEMCEKPATCLDIHHSHLPPMCEEDCDEPPPGLSKKLLKRLNEMFAGRVECFNCQQPIDKCVCKDPRFQAAIFIAEQRARRSLEQPLKDLIEAARIWRRRTDLMRNQTNLALAIDAYEKRVDTTKPDQ